MITRWRPTCSFILVLVDITKLIYIVIHLYIGVGAYFNFRYAKPHKRPDPPEVSDIVLLEVDLNCSSHLKAKRRDLVWKLCRSVTPSEQDQLIPAWSGFNSILSSDEVQVAKVRYLPFIQAPPTDFTTIYSILLRLVSLAKSFGQTHILVTADMAIYSKAQEILWAKPEDLTGKVTMRVGGMHMTMAFLASIGRLYGDAGLLALLTDSDVYAEATARQMLQGKQYARGIRGMKLVSEALFRNFFTSFELWLKDQNMDLQLSVCIDKVRDLQNAIHTRDQELDSLIEHFEENVLPNIEEALEKFRRVGRDSSETFTFWVTFLDGIDILLRILRAERSADFQLHINATCEAVPWFWAAGRSTYAKYVPTYVSDMKALEYTHPESYDHMISGGFVVRRSQNHAFNCVSTDQALEQTVNREGKSKGGVIGYTMKKGALARWLITRHVSAEYTEAFKSLCAGKGGNVREHPELTKSRQERDSTDVRWRLCSCIRTPLTYKQCLQI
jgi:hypothetical protein